MGEPAYTEKPGDLSELDLPLGISEFVKELRKVSDDTTPIVLALVEGRPRLLGDLPHTVRGARGAEEGGGEEEMGLQKEQQKSILCSPLVGGNVCCGPWLTNTSATQVWASSHLGGARVLWLLETNASTKT